MAGNDFLVDALVRRAVLVDRFAAGQVNDAVQVLDDVLAFALQRLLRSPEAADAPRLAFLIRDIQRRSAQLYQSLGTEALQRLEQFGVDSAEFMVQALERATVENIQVFTPSNDQIIQAVTGGNTMVPLGTQQITVGEAIQQFAKAKTDEVVRTINAGMLIGEDNNQIAERVRTLVKKRQRRHAETLVRTMTNHAANQAQNVVLESNQALLQGYEWVSVLDHRTTLICAGRDGRKYKIKKGPLPPAHFNCRSTVTPKLLREFEAQDIGKPKDIHEITYGDWLKDQADSFQNEVLGPTRAELFRQGHFNIDEFRSETGKVYTIDELRNLNPTAFAT